MTSLFIKYRPKKLDDVVIPPIWREGFNRQIEKRDTRALLFDGGPGLGKTTLAKIIAKGITGDKSSILELGGEGDKQPTVEVLQGLVRDFCMTPSWGSGPKCVLLDEADRMTDKGQNELKGLMNVYGEVVKFILTTNWIEKIEPAIQSRCGIRYNFDLFVPSVDEYLVRINHILDKEGLSIAPDVLRTLIHENRGDWRSLLTLVEMKAVPLQPR